MLSTHGKEAIDTGNYVSSENDEISMMCKSNQENSVCITLCMYQSYSWNLQTDKAMIYESTALGVDAVNTYLSYTQYHHFI